MSDLYKNKFRISSARLKNWDYSKEAMYFVTICTKNMERLFGEIAEDFPQLTVNSAISVEMACGMASLQEKHQAYLNPTEIGKAALIEWYRSVDLRPDMNISLDEFTVMPNHIHGIICIGKNEFNSEHYRRDAMHGVSTEANGVSTEANGVSTEVNGVSTETNGVSTEANGVSTQPNDTSNLSQGVILEKQIHYKNQFGPQAKNLSSILRGYKSSVTTFARKENQYFEWQERFHDHIIRSKEEYLKISNYIKNNPSNWLKDKFNPLNNKPSK